MLPLDLIPHLSAPPGWLLVERVGTPSITSAGIILPATYRAAKLSSEAEVLSVGEGIEGFEVGERVILNSNLPRPTVFGLGSEKREIYRITPRYCPAKVHPDLVGEVDTTGRSEHSGWKDRHLDTEPRRDEGDPEGIR